MHRGLNGSWGKSILDKMRLALCQTGAFKMLQRAASSGRDWHSATMCNSLNAMPPAAKLVQDVPSVDATVKELVGNFGHLRHAGILMHIALFGNDMI